MTNWLSIDTAMNACGVGVLRADGQIFEATEFMDRGQSERLMPLILETAAKAGLKLTDIDAYAVTVGPGTFTGLRVGLATIRALAQVSGKPAYGVTTFDALAANLPAGKPACIVIETKRSDYYVRTPDDAGACLSADELKVIVKPDWLIAGDAVDRLKNETGLENEMLFLKAPKAGHIIAEAKKMQGQGVNAQPEPLYLRPADVSISKKKTATIK